MARQFLERNGVSLLETLLGIFVIGVFASLAIPILGRVREQSNQTDCANNLKNLVLSVHNYHADNGKMPPYATGRMNEIYGGWYVYLLAYQQQQEIYERLVQARNTNNRGLRVATEGRYLPGVYGAPFPSLVCPSDPSRGSTEVGDSLTNYLANWYAFTDDLRGFYRPAQKFDLVLDGLSNTVFFAEGYSQCSQLPRLALYSAVYHNFGVTQSGLPSDDPRLMPQDYTMFQVQPSECDKLRSQTPHASMNAALGDGSVRTVSPAVSLVTWKSVLKPRDGTVVGTDW